MQNFRYETAKKIIVEKGGVTNIGSLLSGLGWGRVLIIADAGIEKAGHLQKITESCAVRGIEFFAFTDISSDPRESMVYAAHSAAKKAVVDGIVGIGGGSVMDVAKAASALVKTNGSLEEIYGVGMVKNGRCPLVLIPTTAGTGSEVTNSAVISDEQGRKKVAIDPALYADVALLDVEMLGSVPLHIATTTGIDAMVHAIEAYSSATKKNPMSDMLACEALRYLMGDCTFENSLKPETKDETRLRMLFGSMLAGQAFSNANVSAIHAFAYALSEKFHLPHGLSNALVLVPILRFNCNAFPELYGRLAKEVFADWADLSDRDVIDNFLARLETILDASGLNKGLREYGIKTSDLESLASIASSQERLLQNNPRPISYPEALQIFSSAH